MDLWHLPRTPGKNPATELGEKRWLLFYSRYNCKGVAGVDLFSQNVTSTPGGNTTAFSYYFPPLAMVGHVVQHMAKHAVTILPDVRMRSY